MREVDTKEVSCGGKRQKCNRVASTVDWDLNSQKISTASRQTRSGVEPRTGIRHGAKADQVRDGLIGVMEDEKRWIGVARLQTGYAARGIIWSMT